MTSQRKPDAGLRDGHSTWLFIGHPDAGRRAAILYSLIVSCLRHDKNPAAYLPDVLSRLPAMTNQDDLAALTPRLWQCRRLLRSRS